jgi:hypothetical protein
VRGFPLGAPHSQVFLAPPSECWETEPLLDDPVDMIEYENFGQYQLSLRADLEFANRVVSQTQQGCTRQSLLVLLNSLQNELFVFLTQRLSVASRVIGLEFAQHGTVNLAMT